MWIINELRSLIVITEFIHFSVKQIKISHNIHHFYTFFYKANQIWSAAVFCSFNYILCNDET